MSDMPQVEDAPRFGPDFVPQRVPAGHREPFIFVFSTAADRAEVDARLSRCSEDTGWQFLHLPSQCMVGLALVELCVAAAAEPDEAPQAEEEE